MLQRSKTYIPKPNELKPRWILVDAKDKILGRLATRVARLVRGKENAHFTPHMDTGDFVVVVNAAQLRVTGAKLTDKMYYRHSGYISGLKARPLGEMLARKPEYVVLHAVRGMLPKNKLGRKLLAKVKVYPGPTHPHAAQRPIPLEI